jgi:hypothetical protein
MTFSESERDYERLAEIRSRPNKYNGDISFLLDFIELLTEEKSAIAELVLQLRLRDDSEVRGLQATIGNLKSRLRSLSMDLEMNDRLGQTRTGWLQKKAVKQREELTRLYEENARLREALSEKE